MDGLGASSMAVTGGAGEEIDEVGSLGRPPVEFLLCTQSVFQ
jgi:hypothetical protein